MEAFRGRVDVLQKQLLQWEKERQRQMYRDELVCIDWLDEAHDELIRELCGKEIRGCPKKPKFNYELTGLIVQQGWVPASYVYIKMNAWTDATASTSGTYYYPASSYMITSSSYSGTNWYW